MSIAVDVRDLVKIYPNGVKGVDGATFSVYDGEIFGLIGPNGAGKTTTLRIIATILQPTRGTVIVGGYDVVREADKVRRIISYLPEEAGGYKYLTGREFLEFIARLYSSRESEVVSMVDEGIRLSGLGDRINDKIKSYSKGMLRRLLVAKTLMVKPKIAILDEPTAGLDVVNAVHVRNAIRSYAKEKGVTVLMSSHNMLEVEYLCDRVAIIHNGKIMEIGSPRELKEKYSAENLEEVFIKLVGERI
ncbi:ABC transporter related [Ignisphaera aggregans DSM 17230]|uniref:ABC transporter related n=1 Tax=Ignisphaera aggregans (strain DSM 17230 / JCM 13409 / AQ1.S1) TaxID=583356 RepID=E0SS13_IGNAA|nr:ABC transporter related [Ignisphaera aggregans DSM 17230]